MGMSVQRVGGRALAALVAGLCVMAALAPSVVRGQQPAVSAVTFHADVVPILRDKCQACHAPGEMAPMPLVTYQQVRPWARSIRLKVSKREMPPWFIDRTIGIQEYRNDPSLTDAQIATIVKWVDAGAPEGAAASAPAPRAKAGGTGEGWDIGTPDLIVQKPTPFTLYAKGSDWWQTEVAELNLTEDRWVKAVQHKPGNRSIVHHFCSGTVPGAAQAPTTPADVARSKVSSDSYIQQEVAELLEEVKQNNEGGVPALLALQALTSGAVAGTAPPGITPGGFGCHLPGRAGTVYGDDTGILMEAGSKLRFTMHYSASGTEETDRSEIGFTFYPKGVVPKYRQQQLFFGKTPSFDLDIPPNTRTVHDGYYQLTHPTQLVSFTPHMHMRGRGLILEAILPTGRVMTIGGVKDYNFNWQIEYVFAPVKAPLLPAGTMMHVIVMHDNTADNPHNPDPNRWVGYGQASTEEMAGTFLAWIDLTPEEFRRRTTERRARERATQAR